MLKFSFDRTGIDLTLSEKFPHSNFNGMVVDRAMSPMVLWDNVTVKTSSIQKLSTMERFAIECLLELKECRTEELWEIASMPPEMANWLLGSLVHKGLAECKGRIFMPQIDACNKALEQEGITVEEEEMREFIWFPEVNEVYAVKKNGNLFKQLQSIRPNGQFPLPRKLQNMKRSKIINDALIKGLLFGSDIGSITEIVDDTDFNDETCPAYYFNAMLPYAETDNLRLSVIGYGKKKKNDDNDQKESNNTVIEKTMPFPVVMPGLIDLWRSRLSDAYDNIFNALKKQFEFTDVRYGDNGLLVVMTSKMPEKIYDKWLLVNLFGLQVRINGEIEYTIPLRLQPSSEDQDAVKMFVIDEAIQHILAAQGDFQAVEKICSGANVQLSKIFERLWQIKRFRTVYELREGKDFV